MDIKSALKKLSYRKTWNALKIVLALALFAYVFSKTDYEQLIALKEQFSWKWFGATFLAFIAMLAIKTLQYYVFIGKKISYPRTLEVVIIQNLLMNFVTTVAGMASYLTILGVEKDVRLGKATTSFVLVKIGDVIAVFVFLLISIFFIQPIPTGAMPIVVFICVFAFLFALFLAFFLFFRQSLFAWAIQLASLFKISHFTIVQKGVNYLNETAQYSQKKILRTISTASFLSLAYMGVTMFWGYARFRTLSLSLDFFVVVFIFSLLQFASWIPIYVLGGLGVSEGMSIYLLGLFGVPQIGLAATLIGIRIIVYLLHASTILYLPLRTVFGKSSLLNKSV